MECFAKNIHSQIKILIVQINLNIYTPICRSMPKLDGFTVLALTLLG